MADKYPVLTGSHLAAELGCCCSPISPRGEGCVLPALQFCPAAFFLQSEHATLSRSMWYISGKISALSSYSFPCHKHCPLPKKTPLELKELRTLSSSPSGAWKAEMQSFRSRSVCVKPRPDCSSPSCPGFLMQKIQVLQLCTFC